MFETDSDEKNNSSPQLENEEEEDIEQIEVVKQNCEEHKRLS